MAKKTKPQLNENQLKAVSHDKGPILVVAGAGTGKTRVITERIKHLIENKKIEPNEILALTFTEKASSEMLDRVGDIMPLGYEEPWVYTFHSFADRVLKAEGLEIGIDPSYKILPYSEQWLLLRKNIFDFDLKYFRPLGNPTKFISAILKFISRLQDENISPQELKNFANSYDVQNDEKERWQELAYIYEKYQELKIADSKFDFGDLILWTIKLFETRPNILKKYQNQFKHVLVDEFQDTNYAQYILIKMLCPQSMGNRSLLVVGDDSQSIYKFRGAAVSNILDFMKDYPNAEMVTLIQNYRSTQKILDPAYKLIQNNNPDTLESKLNISKQLVSETAEKGEKPKIIKLETLEDEVDFVISKIFEILGTEPHYTFKDFAILARANNHLDPFVMGLRRNGVPYQLVGNRGLYDRDEIRDILACARVVINPGDAISLYRVLNIESLEIDYEEIASLLSSSRIEKVDLWELVKKSENTQIQTLVAIIETAQKNITKMTPAELVFSLVKAVNYLEPYTKEETVENQLSIKNLDIFLKKIQSFEYSYHSETKEIPTLIDMVDYFDLTIEAGDNPSQAEFEDIDTVNLLTVHASKGLEFPVVFLVNLVSDRFPTRNQKDIIMIPDTLIKETLPTGDEHIQEERRLFYVAATRAKKYLYFTLANNYGGKRNKHQSGFLDETELPILEISQEEMRNESKQVGLFGTEGGFRDPSANKINEFVPKFLSYSQIDMYETCPLQYKYKYVLGIPTKPSYALSFGITIHDTLKEYHQRLAFNEKVNFDELLTIYEKYWQPLGYDNDKHRKLRFDDGKKLLERYYEENKSSSVLPIGLEKSFNVYINGIKFYGKIDRIDPLPDGGVEIIDYKTGTTKDQKEVDKDAQVSFYAIGVKEALKMDPKKLTYYFVESGDKISTTRTQSQLDEKKAEVVEIVSKIKSGDFNATPGKQCEWCDYREICPYAKTF